jgi:hypothetical protein
LSSDQNNAIGNVKQADKRNEINHFIEKNKILTQLQQLADEKPKASSNLKYHKSTLLPFHKTLGTKEVSNAITNNEIHLVCTARKKGAIWRDEIKHFSYHDYVSSLNKLTQINTQFKIGTLFPLRNISMLPLSVYNGRNAIHERKAFKKHFLACLNLNETKVRCPVMLFAFDKQADFNYLLAKEVLAEIMLYQTSLYHTKQVYYCMV